MQFESKNVFRALLVVSFLGAVVPARAAYWPLVLTEVIDLSGTSNGQPVPANLSSSTATWAYDDVAQALYQTGGTFDFNVRLSPVSILYRQQVNGLVAGFGSASASTFQCIEGTVGATLGYHFCGRYYLGGNGLNESSLFYGPGTSFTRTLGGDDYPGAAPFDVPVNVADFDNMYQVVLFVPPNGLIVTNGQCFPNANTGPSCGSWPYYANRGYRLSFGGYSIPPDNLSDTTPASFGFATQTGVALSTVVTSGAATISGINAAAPVSVSGGSYSIGCTATYITSASTINNGQTVCLRHTSSAANATSVVTTLNVGGVFGSFTSTTVGGGDTTPDAFFFTDQLNAVEPGSLRTSNAITVTGINDFAPISVSGGTYSKGCTATYISSASTVTNGQTVCVRHMSADMYSTERNTTLTIGGVSDTFTSRTRPRPDTTPDAFAFTPETGVPLSSVRTSNTVSITGINAATQISVVGGSYSINGGGYTSSVGGVSNNDTVTVRHTSSASFNTAVNTTLTVGGVVDTFTSTTLAALPDTTPDPFTFTDQTDVALSAAITSDPLNITGIDAPAPISVTGGQYSIGCTASFTGAAGTISPGQTVCVRHTSAAAGNTETNTVLTVGGVSDTFTSTTGTAAPDTFTFVDVTGVALSAQQTSNAVTIAGITASSPVSVSGGQYSIGCTTAFTSALGAITNGQTVCVRHTSAPNNGVDVDTTLTIGGVSDTFRSTTATDTTPEPFGFSDQIQQPLFTLVTSNTVTINGINGPAAIAVIGGEYSIGCGTFTAVPGTIINGQTVCVRQTTSANNGGRVNTQLTVGGVTGLFFTTTVLADPVVVPDAPPDPTPAIDPPVVLFDKSEPATAATIQDIGIETDGVVTGGTAVIGFCTAVDPRETEGPGGTYRPRPLPLSDLAGTCSSLAGETLVVPPYMRPIPDAGGVRRFVISTANSTIDLEGLAVSQGYGEDIVAYTGGVSPPCNVPLSNRPLWLWGVRAGEEVDGVLTDENQVMKPTSIQCNASRSGTRRFSNFIQNVSLDEGLYSSASYTAGQNKDLDKVLDKLDVDDNSCNASLQSLTVAMKAQAAICRTATVFAIVTRDTTVAPVRIGRTVYQYAMKVKLRNYGGPVTSAQAVIRSGVPTTAVTGGVVTRLFAAGIGPAVGGGYTETAEQIFTIQQDRLLPVDVGVLLPAVTFVPDLTGANATRYPDAIAGCEQVARLAKQNRPAFDSCPANIRAKKYRGAIESAGLGAAFTIYDRLARPLSGGGWSIYPLPPDIVEPGQIPPGP